MNSLIVISKPQIRYINYRDESIAMNLRNAYLNYWLVYLTFCYRVQEYEIVIMNTIEATLELNEEECILIHMEINKYLFVKKKISVSFWDFGFKNLLPLQ